jgi:hypothetical protein
VALNACFDRLKPLLQYGDYWPSAVADSRSVSFDNEFLMSPLTTLVAGRPGIAYRSVGGVQFAAAR